MISVLINAIKVLHISMEKSKIYKLIGIFLVALFVCSTAFYVFESKANADLSYGDSLWWGFVTTTTVGYGDYFPITIPGRLFGIALMLIGISTFGFLTAAIASIFIDNKMKEGMGLMDIKFENHIVLIGWNKKSETMLKELVEDSEERKIVIVSDIERLNLPYKNTYFVHGDPTIDETLIRANISCADIVMVVADENLKNNDGMADAKSVLVCLAVDKFNTNIHLIAEVLNEENIPHFERANVNDIIVSNQMSSRVMVRSAVYKNVSSVLKELLTNSYGNELYECKVKKDDIGISFKELSMKYINDYNTIVVGIANEKVSLNPDKDRKIKKDDVIIYISNEKL
ncbi:potassium channel family protein [Vallitalea guaymasensis]|uniref:Potassium channel family protein n=1 Tax=Vallitalea guaymasensis TaxID=1185412 RepID=A0A8J8M7V3_9FIRM|nr:potassium channel family protein [Vallitalea guaymasensis]QUH27823.1 potassium channel family protein [Vallitalea guaymasensis]